VDTRTANTAITELTPADIPAAIALWESTPGIGLSSADDPAELERFLAQNAGLCFKATIAADETAGAGSIAGTVLCGSDGRRGYIYHLAVAVEHRRNGIARELIDRVVAALGERGIQKVHAMVFAANPDGRAAWDALGWSRRDDLVTYSRSLIPG
jgi:ribosomal protein S18 acetylase RimI-like enzyme